jgi:hypothetical protein
VRFVLHLSAHAGGKLVLGPVGFVRLAEQTAGPPVLGTSAFMVHNQILAHPANLQYVFGMAIDEIDEFLEDPEVIRVLLNNAANRRPWPEGLMPMLLDKHFGPDWRNDPSLKRTLGKRVRPVCEALGMRLEQPEAHVRDVEFVTQAARYGPPELARAAFEALIK